MAMSRVEEALEVELKALSPAFLTDPPPLPHAQCFRDGCLLFMGPWDGKNLDPRVYQILGWKAASEGKTVFALAVKVSLKLLSHQCTGVAVTHLLLDHQPLGARGSGGIAIPGGAKNTWIWT